MRGRYRWWIGGLLFLSTVINYLDRQTLSVLGPTLKTEFSWSNQDFALIIIAFRIAYAVMQTVSGRVLDRVGTRRGLTVSVLWYSTVAVLTSLATGLRSFCGFRFLLGAGEDKTVRLWELEIGRCVATEPTSGAALCLSVSADGRRAAVGTYDRKVLVWDVNRPA